MEPLNNYLLWSLSYYVYLVDNITLRLNFQRVYSIGESLSYYMCLITCMCV